MFTVQEFFTEKPKAALIADKIRTYENRAMKFFREQFSPLADQLDDDQLRSVVKLAYENAKKRGITTERGHWKYLIMELAITIKPTIFVKFRSTMPFIAGLSLIKHNCLVFFEP